MCEDLTLFDFWSVHSLTYLSQVVCDVEISSIMVSCHTLGIVRKLLMGKGVLDFIIMFWHVVGKLLNVEQFLH
jgi:hypothetical protein